MDGLRLTFHLAGINNQNFLMRDDETGTYWQQVSGAAVSGPFKGRNLVLVSSDELTFGLWKTEQPHGTLVKDDAKFISEYAPNCDGVYEVRNLRQLQRFVADVVEA